ncbi:MAG: sulfotransferase family 2 domain-containing protein [Flavobacteriales bacterium]|nr:sulfotransferase family 2 domain-containing protein [Flavobacteriales bacterium]
MSKPGQPFTLVYEHVPKTAGSTMHGIIGRQYRGATQFKVASTERERRASIQGFEAMSQQERDSLDLLSGHCALTVEHLVNRPKRYITFMRDPYQQFKSGFYYIRRAHWNQHHQDLIKMKDLREYLDYRVERGVDNMQTRYLSGVLDAVAPPEPGGRVERSVDEALFNKASAWLARMDHVGLTESFDASILLMQQGLGWKRHCHYQVQNRTKDRPDPALEEGLEERFRSVYRWDLQLYAQAKARFERDLAQAGPAFAGKLARFQLVNRLAQRIYPLLPPRG